MVTVRDLIAALEAAAQGLPGGLGTAFRVGVCDGQNLRMLDQFDVHPYTVVPAEGGRPGGGFVALRAHQHPGEEPGEVMRGVAADVDDELGGLGPL